MTHHTPAVPPPQKQLTLFPLHPEDREDMLDVGVSRTTCRLRFLPSRQNDMSSEEEAALVRTAMRSREREVAAEEKWVCYSEVVEKKEEPSEEVEEVTSTAADEWQCLCLKLDYEGILNAWSDKAPLFINGESPQIVPDLHHDDPILCCSDSLPNGSILMDGNMWRVPEINNIGWKMRMGQREASVLRYKEKRQNRLFANRIRYQVRKLNADKRPRIKGRFVKRS